jgi:hypothetical protein
MANKRISQVPKSQLAEIQKEKAIVVTRREIEELFELVMAIHGLHQVLENANDDGSIAACEIADLLRPIDNQLCDFHEMLDRRQDKGGAQ